MFVRKTVALTMFTGFKVGRSELFVTYLQYFGDTLFIGNAAIENLQAIKTFQGISSLPQVFELILLSYIIVSNVDASFLGLAANFLHYSVCSLPFKYLDLSIGANSRRFCQPLLDIVVTRLSSWNNKFVNIGGRVILLGGWGWKFVLPLNLANLLSFMFELEGRGCMFFLMVFEPASMS